MADGKAASTGARAGREVFESGLLSEVCGEHLLDFIH